MISSSWVMVCRTTTNVNCPCPPLLDSTVDTTSVSVVSRRGRPRDCRAALRARRQPFGVGPVPVGPGCSRGPGVRRARGRVGSAAPAGKPGATAAATRPTADWAGRRPSRLATSYRGFGLQHLGALEGVRSHAVVFRGQCWASEDRSSSIEGTGLSIMCPSASAICSV